MHSPGPSPADLLDERSLVVSTLDPALAHDEICSVYCDARWQVQEPASARPIVLHHAAFGDFALSTVRYGRALSVRTAGDDSVLVLAGVLSGQVSVQHGKQSLEGGAGSVALVPLSDGTGFRYDADGATFKLAFQRSRVESFCRRLLDDAVPRRIDFDLEVRDPGQRQAWAAYARLLAASAAGQPAPLPPLTEELLLTALLYGQPHSCSDRLQQAAPTLAPRQVKRAMAFIDVHFGEALTLERLADVAGCSMRSLHRGFRTTLEVSPMRYLRDVRLGHARQQLRDDSDARTITAIALGCGFAHLGDFAGHYKKAFGETPAQTRRGRRDGN